MSRMNAERKQSAGRVVAVAIENNKTSQHAAKWAVENLVPKDQSLLLLHVKQRHSSNTPGREVMIDKESKDLFDAFRVFCNRKSMQCKEVLLEDMDITKGIVEGINKHSIEILVVGAASKGGIVRRFRTTDVASTTSKAAPGFCTVYTIHKGKVSSVRSATTPLPKSAPPPRNNTQHLQQQQPPERIEPQFMRNYPPRPGQPGSDKYMNRHQVLSDDDEFISPFASKGGRGHKYESTLPDSDISFVSNGRPSIDQMFPTLYEDLDSSAGLYPRPSFGCDYDSRLHASSFSIPKSLDMSSHMDNHSYSSQSTSGAPSTRLSDSTEEVEAEMRRLKRELKHTMEMYSSACQEALNAKQKAMQLQKWKVDEEKKLDDARVAEGAAMAMVEMEQEKCKAAMKAAEASQKIASLEAQKRMNVERKSEIDAIQRKKTHDSYAHSSARYRRYTIEEIEAATQNFSESLKIGEGGYGPVYRCELDHTQVAIKVLKSDAAQGRAQFQQEVEVLSCIRHPNMVLLLGACPEYGCIVYEYMGNGSLDDCLFRRGKAPPLPWQVRFQIAAEIATGLLFLHQTKPEPIVHRDLKPGNILLDRNYVSKIGDVGLARLVPASYADSVTQYRMTSTAGTFCYIDPEYQQTGMLGIKSDIYSLGVMLLQLITAKPPMGLTHHVERSIEKGTFVEMLDPAIDDWPLEQTLHFAKLSIQCAEMRRKDRPDLGKVVLPELNKLRIFAEDNMPMMMYRGGGYSQSRSSNSPSNSTNQSRNSNSPTDSTVSTAQDIMSGRSSLSGNSGSSTSSLGRV